MNWKSIWAKITGVPGWLVLLLAAGSTVGIAWVFATGNFTAVAAYALYPVAFYTLFLLIFGMPKLVREIRTWVAKHAWLNRVATDGDYRSYVFLYAGLTFNLLFGLFKLYTSWKYASVWVMSVGFYYIASSIIRFLLARNVKSSGYDQTDATQTRRELHAYRIAGWLMLLLNLTISGVAVQIVRDHQTYSYPGTVIYAAAVYVFFCAYSSTAGAIRYHNHPSPALSGAKKVAFARTLMAVFALETAMLSQFGDAGGTSARYGMAATAAVVCTVIMVLAVRMIAWSEHQLKEGKETE